MKATSAPLFLILSAGTVLAFPPLDTAGSGALITGDCRLALEVLKRDSSVTDSAYWHFKQGVAYFKCQDYERAIPQFRQCLADSSRFRGIAYEFIGDVETARSRFSDAATAYLFARRDSLPQALLQEISEKLYALVKAQPLLAGPFPELAALAAEKTILLEQAADTVGPKIDSLLKSEQWQAADSMLAAQIDTALTKRNCRIVDVVAAHKLPDSVFSTALVFRLSRAAYACKEWAVADTLLARAEARRDFGAAVPRKDYCFQKGMVSYSLSRYAAAIKALMEFQKKFGPTPDAVLTLGRANRSTGHDTLAEYWYNQFAKLYPKHPNTPDVYWYLAGKEEEDGHFAKAAGLYQKLAKLKKFPRAEEAFFRKGLCWYKAGAYARACSTFIAFTRGNVDAPLESGAQYWKAKCLLALGKHRETAEAFRVVVRTAPADYYAFRAREMLTLSGDTVGFPVLDTTYDAASTRAWIDSVSPPQKIALAPADSACLERGTMFALCGLTGLAGRFLDGLEMRYPSNLGLEFDLAWLYKRANDPTLSFRVARRLSWRVPPEARAIMPLPLYELLYPLTYGGEVAREASRYGVDPYLVLAVMRQESIFDPCVQSRAGAIGLMQIMPFTGRAIGQAIGDPFSTDSLYRPVTNIRYGAFYLKQLLDQFQGNLVLALASYNGGPVKAAEWYAKNKRKTFDLFIEDIGFTETRGYVKKVLANYWNYRKFADYRPFP
ncbi:MAG TPA: transglycosylase SLT domain-containing protein [Chitinivibrionales bacterium]|nr:transglycosylase SLT domain-containing protein [Chitinivibrionales bacterium]